MTLDMVFNFFRLCKGDHRVQGITPYDLRPDFRANASTICSRAILKKIKKIIKEEA